MSNQEILQSKFDAVKSKALALDKRSNPRPPGKLQWVAKALQVSTWGNLQNATPPGHAPLLANYGGKLTELDKQQADKLARSFCALEDFEAWLDRASVGASIHQMEIERQSASKITRMETYGALT